MGPGLQLLAMTSTAEVASQVNRLARGAAQNFAELFSSASTESDTPELDVSNHSPTESIDQIHSALAEHLKQLGLPSDTPLQVEILGNGKVFVHTDSKHRLELDDAIAQDEELAGKLRAYARGRVPGGESYFVHWPSVESSAAIGK